MTMHRSMRLSCIAVLATSLVACGCSKSGESSSEGAPVLVPFTLPDLPADGKHQVVAVVDNGFDLSLPVFQGKIAGGYTVKCVDYDEQPTSFDEAKRQLLAHYAVKDTHCHLVSGITLRRSAKLDEIAGKLAAWNASIIGHTGDDSLSDVPKILGGEDSYTYHGTSTAALIAYRNPNVRIVFIENEGIRRSARAAACPSAESLRLDIALDQDPEVRAAYLSVPSPAVTDELAAVYRHHGVTLQNESFGPLSLAALQNKCPDVADLYATFSQLEADLTGAREHAFNDKDYAGIALLSVRSAGNDGATIASLVDHVDCPSDPRNVSYGPSSRDVMIGSSAPGKNVPSHFSNIGPCVLAYAPGEHVVTLAPGGFLAPFSGTSFAAPLVVRHFSMSPVGTTPEAMRAMLADAGTFLPDEWFPSELLYDLTPPGTPITF
jgi:hypothetical protein